MRPLPCLLISSALCLSSSLSPLFAVTQESDPEGGAETFLVARDLLVRDGAGMSSGSALAVVDGEPISLEEIFPFMFLTQTELVFGALEQAVRSRLVQKESERLGVRVREDDLDREVERVLKIQNDEFKLAAGPEVEFESFIKERYGTTAAVYQRAVRSQVLEELFLTRLVRYESRLHDRMAVRIIVVNDLELAREIVEKLEEGANFASLARSSSLDRSSVRGGLFPPVAVDTPHSLLVGANSLQPGDIAEISTIERGNVRLYRVLRLERLIPGDSRPFTEQSAEVEEGLEERAIDPFEILEWDRRARELHTIDVKLGRA